MLKTKVAVTANAATVTVTGTLDERSGSVLTDLLPTLKRVHVTLDVLGIANINSLGFRHWTTFLKALSEQVTFDVVNAPQLLLDYASLVPTIAFASRIASFQVVFRCTSCQKDVVKVFEVDAVLEDDVFPRVVCSRCNGLATARASPEDCVGFLRHG